MDIKSLVTDNLNDLGEIHLSAKDSAVLLTIVYDLICVERLYERIARLENALQDIADEKTFNHYDCADCTEEVYEVGKSLVQTARDVLQEGE